MYLILTRFLELSIGIISIIGLKNKVNNRDTISMKDLLKQIESKDKEIERLKIMSHAWRMRHEHHLKEHKN